MKFTYNSGQRPLDGYTLKRGIGRGGFGEVYYAVSDGGKEVALKLVRSNHDVEMRGMAQCLNLKHTNLVSLFDLRTDAQGDHWVVMEYIAGEPLSAVLNRHPQGLPPELAQQWFIALARAVGYLHDHGIVHRDLKPANIFIEQGLVKVGDYGLCKFISGSHRTAQTQSVGTVHYMAPEISTGNYNRQIDVYAAGIILYEMLTGRVPFEGESAGEILMKHLTAPPDLTKLTPQYAGIVGKALEKNPALRYSTLAEMIKDLEGVGNVPALQPVVAVAAASPVANDVPVVEVQRRKPRPEAMPEVLAPPTFRGQLAELCGSMVLAVVLSGVSTTLWAALSNGGHPSLFAAFYLTIACCWAILIPAKFWSQRRGDAWVRRVVMMALGMGIGFAALWLDGFVLKGTSRSIGHTSIPGVRIEGVGFGDVAGYLSYFALAFFALRWWKLADRRRPHRFSFAPIVAAGFWGLALLFIWQQDEAWRGTLILTTSAAIVQLVSPWEQPPPPITRRMRLRCA
jgi:hypothetical protein